VATDRSVADFDEVTHTRGFGMVYARFLLAHLREPAP
jgi:hypothetical protein